MSNFHVGQKVVYFDDVPQGREGRIRRSDAEKAGAKYPTKGTVYTIREVFTSFFGPVAVLLSEIDNSDACTRMGKVREAGFEADRFRPVVERGTEKGMSILRELLTKTGKPVEEAA